MLQEYIVAIGYYLTLFLLAIVFLYGYHLYKKEKELEDRRNKFLDSSSAIVERAHKKAEIIIEDAVERTQDILSETTEFRSDIQKQLKSVLQGSINEYIQSIENDTAEIEKSYVSMARKEQDEYKKEADETYIKLKEIGDREIEDLQHSLKDHKFSSEEYLKKQVDAQFIQAKKEIEEYKSEQFKQIETSVHKVVQEVAEKVLLKSLSQEDQERLVLESLAEAKKGGAFVV